jgi:hypothetical protein
MPLYLVAQRAYDADVAAAVAAAAAAAAAAVVQVA